MSNNEENSALNTKYPPTTDLDQINANIQYCLDILKDMKYKSTEQLRAILDAREYLVNWQENEGHTLRKALDQ